jgi:hypothetical protein
VFTVAAAVFIVVIVTVVGGGGVGVKGDNIGDSKIILC